MAITLRDYHLASKRRGALEKELNITLPQIGNFTLDEDYASTHNCENMIGSIQVPLGVAGPLKIKDKNMQQDFFLPLATTEGALVASVARGCKAITESGGTHVTSKRVGITRAPVFSVSDIAQATEFITWVKSHTQIMKEIAEQTSHHLTLLSVRPWHIGQNVFLRFQFDTHDAMGMNMATIAVSRVVTWIEEQTRIMCSALSGNMCVDKKPNFLNFIEGRGIQIWADVIIPESIISSVLKTDKKRLVKTAKQKLLFGSILSGSIGANAHAANVLAALFLATGQDIAHIAECSMVVTELEEVAQGMYASVYLPDLVIGTVGGGTNLSTQKEALTILGIHGGDSGKNAIQLAQVFGAAVLAGEISLLSALASNHLAYAHQQLGRGGKTNT